MHDEKCMHPSNYELRVVANSRPELAAAVQIAFERDETRVKFWRVECGWLALSEYADEGRDQDKDQVLPFAMNAVETAEFVRCWLAQERPRYPPDDTDGSAEGDAFELCAAAAEGGVVLRVRKTWSVYHK